MKLAKLPKTETTIRFSAELVRPKVTGKNRIAALVAMPKKASAQLPSQGKTMVEGTVAGFPFRAPLEGGEIRISETLLKACGASAGEEVTVELTRIGDQHVLAQRFRVGAGKWFALLPGQVDQSFRPRAAIEMYMQIGFGQSLQQCSGELHHRSTILNRSSFLTDTGCGSFWR